MFVHVSLWGVFLGALSAMVVGAIWYSRPVFGNKWMKYTGISDKTMKEKGPTAFPTLIAVSILTAYILSLFIVYFHTAVGGSWMKAGVDTALLAWLGFGVTTVFAHSAFDTRDTNLDWINIGNRLVTLVVMGAIIAAFMK